MSQLHLPQAVPPYSNVLRVTLDFNGEKVSLGKVASVAMRVPAVTTPEPDDKTAGYWLELRDAGGKILYHQPLHDPLRRDVEVFGDAPGQPMRRVPGVRSTGSFEVLVPDLPEGARLVVRGPQIGARAARADVGSELAGFDVNELRRHAGNAARGQPPSPGGIQ